MKYVFLRFPVDGMKPKQATLTSGKEYKAVKKMSGFYRVSDDVGKELYIMEYEFHECFIESKKYRPNKLKRLLKTL